MAEEEAQAPEENAAAEGEAQAPAEEAAQAPAEEAPKPPSMLVPMLLSVVVSVAGAFAIVKFVLPGALSKWSADNNGTITIVVNAAEPSGEEGKKEGEDGHAKEGKGGEEGEEPAAEGGADGTDPNDEVPIVDDGDFIVINPADAGNRTHLMVEIYLLRRKADDNAFPKVVKQRRKQLQQLVLTELSALTVAEMSNNITKDAKAAEFKDLFQGILGSSHPIKSVIISKWVMQ